MRSHRVFVAFLLGALAAGCQSGVESRLEHARELVFQDRPQAAVAEYRSLLVRLEGDERPFARDARIEAYSRIADLSYVALRDYQAAADAYRALITEAPEAEESWAAREKLADLSRRYLGDFAEAINQWQILATSGRPDAGRFGYQVAKAYFERRDYEQCRSESRIVAEREGDGKWAHDALFLLATAFQFEGKHEEAVSAFQEIRERWPDTEIAARAAYQVGQSLLAQDDPDGALEAYLDALQRHPDPQRVQADIARARSRAAEAARIRTQDPRRAAFGG